MWEQDPEAMKPAMVRQDEILEKTIAGNRGFVFSRMSDGITVAFATAGDAVAAALAIKHALTDGNWRSSSPPKARIGLQLPRLSSSTTADMRTCRSTAAHC